MDAEGYPEQNELDAIKNWDYKDFLGLVEYVRQRWNWSATMAQTNWEKDSKRPVLVWTLHTGGWSGNEDLIAAVLDNKMFRMIWYYSWQRGGHFVFKINPYNVGYMTVREYCKNNNVSRQYVSKIKDKFNWIHIEGQPDICKRKE